MANPLKMLKLKPTGFQIIQEIAVNAPPKKVWAALIRPETWFGFDGMPPTKHTFEAAPGGRWIIESEGVSYLMATITHVEPNKLLRLGGSMGLSHLPVNNAFIYELQAKGEGKTLLRCGQRCYGFITADIKKNYAGGWKQLLPKLKAAAEKA